MRFTKMQGAGNDSAYVNCLYEPLPLAPAAPARPLTALAARLGAQFERGEAGLLADCLGGDLIDRDAVGDALAVGFFRIGAG